jgi:predicted pyridoxine 5'-phosphate oxidase superfamily flavin-nucleotide-binding protein
MQNPFHEGERKVQRLAGEESKAERNGIMIADRIIGGALPFLSQQSMAVFGSRDDEGRLWASMFFGSRGFMNSSDGKSVDFDLTKVAVQPLDPFWRNAEANPAVGMIAIELGSRRRIRVNGEISRPAEDTLRLKVREAYPNCPKYITRRIVRAAATADPFACDPNSGEALAPAQRNLLEGAGTLFIATAHPTRGADASHRGGNPGFIEVMDGKTLRIPDYAGNSLFNTLGNLLVHPSAGLVVPDFEAGRVLQLTGRAEVLFDSDDPLNASGGTRRFVLFHIAEWLEVALPPGMASEFLDYSPFNPRVIAR